MKQSALPATSGNVTAIGVGAGLGTLVLVVITMLGTFCVLRRRRNGYLNQSCKSLRASSNAIHQKQMPPHDQKTGTGLYGTGHPMIGHSPNILFEAPDKQLVLHELEVTLPGHEAGGFQPGPS